MSIINFGDYIIIVTKWKILEPQSFIISLNVSIVHSLFKRTLDISLGRDDQKYNFHMHNHTTRIYVYILDTPAIYPTWIPHTLQTCTCIQCLTPFLKSLAHIWSTCFQPFKTTHTIYTQTRINKPYKLQTITQLKALTHV